MDTQALKQEDCSDFGVGLAKGDSANDSDEASLITKYYCNRDNKEVLENFDPNLIDVFLRVLSDPEYPSGLHLHASTVLCKLMERKRHPLMHTILEKGALDVFLHCIRTTEYGTRDNCMYAVSEIAKHCTQCTASVRKTRVLETIANLIQSGAIDTLSSHTAAVSFFLDVLLTGNASLEPKVALQLVHAISITLRSFGSDGKILKDSLNCLTGLTFPGNFSKSELVFAQIDVILREEVIITMAFDVIATGSTTLVSAALSVFVNLSSGGDGQDMRLMMREGFMQMLVDCLDSSSREVRCKALSILGNLIQSSHIELILREVRLIAKLMLLMDHHDLDLQKKVCEVFSRTFVVLATRPVTSMEDFVGNGVGKIVECASKSGADPQVVNMIREVLPKQLLTHPEFNSIAEEVSLRSENFNTVILDWWRVMRGWGSMIKGFAESLKSFASSFRRFRATTHTVSESDASTVELGLPQANLERE